MGQGAFSLAQDRGLPTSTATKTTARRRPQGNVGRGFEVVRATSVLGLRVQVVYPRRRLVHGFGPGLPTPAKMFKMLMAKRFKNHSFSGLSVAGLRVETLNPEADNAGGPARPVDLLVWAASVMAAGETHGWRVFGQASSDAHED